MQRHKDRLQERLECFSESYHKSLKNLIDEKPVHHGTILKISNLRDIWDENATQNIYDDLGVLVPPTEGREFVISLVSLDTPLKYGEVENSFCDDCLWKRQIVMR